MISPRRASSSRSASPAVLILCADDALAKELIRELAGRRYQPLVGRPDWSWKVALEWARPVAAVVHTQHPAASSEGFPAASDDLECGVVVFGESTPAGAKRARVRTAVPGADAKVIGGAVDEAVRGRSR
jgi:hypothetical protein